MGKRSVKRTRPAGSYPFSVIRQVAPKPEAPTVPAVELERAEGEGMPVRPDTEDRIQISGPALQAYAEHVEKRYFPDGLSPGLITEQQDTSAQDVLDRAFDLEIAALEGRCHSCEKALSEVGQSHVEGMCAGCQGAIDKAMEALSAQAVKTALVSQVGAFTAEEFSADRNFQEPNFRDKKTGKFQLVKCFWCRPEGRGNLAPDTARSICHWCGARAK